VISLVKLRGLHYFLSDVGGTLSQKIARGSAWAFASYGLEQGLFIIRSIILARLLTPADFGLMGIASLTIAFFDVFTKTGIWSAILQRLKVDQPVLNTAWLISVARGFILGLAIFLSAPWVALIFKAPPLGPMLRMMALSSVLGGLNSLGLVLMQKELDFRSLAAVNLIAGGVNLIFACVAAFLLRSVWALVVGMLAGSVAALVLSYLAHPFRPRLRFDRQHARELLGFGKFLTASRIALYVLTQGDDAYVGKVLGTEPLGLYRLAYRISSLPDTGVAQVICRVMLPAYSALQDDLDQLRRTYLRTLKLTALVAIPMAAGFLGLAPYIIAVLYGEQWMPAVPALQILCLYGLERAIGALGGSLILALGRPDIGLRVIVVKLIVMVLCIGPLTARYGIVGTSTAMTLSAMAVQGVVIAVTANLLRVPWSTVVQPLLKPLAGSLLMLGVLYAVQRVALWPQRFWALGVLIALGITIYGGFVTAFEKRMLQDLRTKLRSWTALARAPEPVE
jgi:O-antigen/teichoic acid export membrane protein